jgi:hypothetical protein
MYPVVAAIPEKLWPMENNRWFVSSKFINPPRLNDSPAFASGVFAV